MTNHLFSTNMRKKRPIGLTNYSLDPTKKLVADCILKEWILLLQVELNTRGTERTGGDRMKSTILVR